MIGAHAQIRNFVETKMTVPHPRAEANHLAYLGEAQIGEGATIGSGAFIGCNSKLVAPVEVGATPTWRPARP